MFQFIRRFPTCNGDCCVLTVKKNDSMNRAVEICYLSLESDINLDLSITKTTSHRVNNRAASDFKQMEFKCIVFSSMQFLIINRTCSCSWDQDWGGKVGYA